jgi:hypothetical protein
MTPSRKAIVKGLTRKQGPTFAKTTWASEKYRTEIIKHHSLKLGEEAKAICSSSGETCSLRSKQVESILSLNWMALHAELSSKAPLLMSVLEAVTPTKRKPQKKLAHCMCVSVLLFARTKNMSLIQRLVSVLLYAGHASKQVYTRLNYMGLCMSYKQSIRIMESLGKNHDQEIYTWSKQLEDMIPTDPEIHVPRPTAPSSNFTDDSDDEDLQEFYDWLNDDDVSDVDQPEDSICGSDGSDVDSTDGTDEIDMDTDIPHEDPMETCESEDNSKGTKL